MTCMQVSSLRSPPWSQAGSPQTSLPRTGTQCRFRTGSFAAENPNALKLIGCGVGLRGGRLISRVHAREKKLGSSGVVNAELGSPQSVAGIVNTVKLALTSSPPSWESATIATTTIFLAGAPVLLAGLSLSGYACAYALGLLTWRAFGWRGTLIVSLYFVLGTIATKVKIKQKEAAGIAEKKSGRRGPGSVFGSWTAGAVCAAATIAAVGRVDANVLWRLGFLASFCTKLSDTISSEIGKAYGKTTYLVTTFSVVPRGTEGAISLEGTIAGLIASVILAAVAYSINLTDQFGAVICVLAAQVANFCESYIGAALQGREGFKWITNDIANVANITIGAVLAAAIKSLTG
ncbi:protein VTE6, chloroplastic [Physcomitrium patens]|uniref:Uncharacterized protein n=2 Tax=Physcomitrium patens TaxID=3218 RepID=A0A2K1JMH9_PHYPA|nr:protein VTE6, chloroplastic-like [Physcomitrium patens]PNR42586.1 hypothetical protein PHYPA_017416 [Physcomitrium patens]|eukprot:XP_024391878.1 protein VTE6, chloroplastic-like [Physcomitrella patens]